MDWVVNNPATGKRAKIVLGDNGLVELARVLGTLRDGTILKRIDLVDSGANSVDSFRKVAEAMARVSKTIGLVEVHFERNHLVRTTRKTVDMTTSFACPFS